MTDRLAQVNLLPNNATCESVARSFNDTELQFAPAYAGDGERQQ